MKDTPRVNLGCDENRHSPQAFMENNVPPTLCQAAQQPVTCDIFLGLRKLHLSKNHHPCKIGGGCFAPHDLLRILMLPGRLQLLKPSSSNQTFLT